MTKPFEGDSAPSVQSSRIGLKKVSSQKSVFEEMPKKPTASEFQEQVQQVQERNSSYKSRAADLALQFNKAMSDKTLSQNKNMFQNEVELDLLRNMVKLAQEVNADVNERDGEGSLSWIIILLKTCFAQRDRINNLQYTVVQIQKKLEELDKPKKSE